MPCGLSSDHIHLNVHSSSSNPPSTPSLLGLRGGPKKCTQQNFSVILREMKQHAKVLDQKNRKQKYKKSTLSLQQLEEILKLNDLSDEYIWHGLRKHPFLIFNNKWNTSYRFNISVLYPVLTAFSSGDPFLFYRKPCLYCKASDHACDICPLLKEDLLLETPIKRLRQVIERFLSALRTLKITEDKEHIGQLSEFTLTTIEHVANRVGNEQQQ